MKSVFGLLCLALLTLAATGFCPTKKNNAKSNSVVGMTKKYPAGRPFTGQADEDMAMWIEEDKKGNRKRALKKPVGGRPVTLYTKEQVEAIEKRGVTPTEKVGIWLETITKPLRRGY